MFLLAFKHLLRIMRINPNPARSPIAEDQIDLCESPNRARRGGINTLEPIFQRPRRQEDRFEQIRASEISSRSPRGYKPHDLAKPICRHPDIEEGDIE
jgi:hypothetical protein